MQDLEEEGVRVEESVLQAASRPSARLPGEMTAGTGRPPPFFPRDGSGRCERATATCLEALNGAYPAPSTRDASVTCIHATFVYSLSEFQSQARYIRPSQLRVSSTRVHLPLHHYPQPPHHFSHLYQAQMVRIHRPLFGCIAY